MLLLPLLLLALTGTGSGANSPIPFSEIGARATADYQGDGLAVRPTAEGARLRCVFQRLEGEATHEGLWLTSTVTNAVNDRFRVVATAVGRQSSTAGEGVTSLPSNARSHREPTNERNGKRQRTAALQNLSEFPPLPDCAKRPGVRLSSAALAAAGSDTVKEFANTGTVAVDGQTVRFTRPGLVEEYSVSMDGVR